MDEEREERYFVQRERRRRLCERERERERESERERAFVVLLPSGIRAPFRSFRYFQEDGLFEASFSRKIISCLRVFCVCVLVCVARCDVCVCFMCVCRRFECVLSTTSGADICVCVCVCVVCVCVTHPLRQCFCVCVCSSLCPCVVSSTIVWKRRHLSS